MTEHRSERGRNGRGQKGMSDVFNQAAETFDVAVRNGVCQGCFVRLSSGALQQLIRQDDLNLCENCGRYVYPEQVIVQATSATIVKASRPKRRRVAKLV